MAKEEEEDISFPNVLYRVINGLEPPQALLDHPEFQRRATRLCKTIKRSGHREELVREVCLQIFQSGHLKPADLQNEEQFWRWFFVVAGNHLRARSRDCIEPSKNWSDTTADLPFAELDQLFAHADLCPYHQRILLIEGTAADEQFDSLVQVARGLDPDRKIRSVEHLIAATDDVREGLYLWNEAALTGGYLFEYIGLYNAEKKVATVCRFSDVRTHVSTHELNARAGLQIRAITAKYPNCKVLLAAFALIGVEHDNVEKYVHLANGYTIGLSIKQLTSTRFTLGFRCVRTEIIGKEQAALNQVKEESGLTEASDDIDVKPSTQARSMPAYLAASLRESALRNARHCSLGLILMLLLPLLQPLNSRDAVDPNLASKSDVHASTKNGEQFTHNTEKEVERTTQRLRHRARHSGSSSSEVSWDLIEQELKNTSTPVEHAYFTPEGRIVTAATSTRVENVTVWQVRVYETKPRPELVVTHFVDNEKIKDQLEQWLPQTSMRSVVLATAKYWDLPQTGYEVKWKTNYAHKQIVSVEATVERLGESKRESTSILKEACTIAGCQDWLLSANAIANVYGYINPAWKASIVLAMKSLGQCLFESGPQSSILRDSFSETGVSGSTFDEIPNCSQSPASPPTN